MLCPPSDKVFLLQSTVSQTLMCIWDHWGPCANADSYSVSLTWAWDSAVLNKLSSDAKAASP